jgi:hypothetical protein
MTIENPFFEAAVEVVATQPKIDAFEAELGASDIALTEKVDTAVAEESAVNDQEEAGEAVTPPKILR